MAKYTCNVCGNEYDEPKAHSQYGLFCPRCGWNVNTDTTMWHVADYVSPDGTIHASGLKLDAKTKRVIGDSWNWK